MRSPGPQPPSDCLFCSVHNDEEEDLVWYDRPILKEGDVGVAISGVGAFRAGYVLVSPAQHMSSVQGLPPNAARDFAAFVSVVVERVKSTYGPVTIFEHGSCRSEERRRSACLTHSHIHIIPGKYSFDTLGLPAKMYGQLSDIWKEPASKRADGYLMYREPGGPIFYAPDVGVSQYFRRHIARVLGCPDEWDYAVFPRWRNVRDTQTELALDHHKTSNLPRTPSEIAAASCI